MRKAAYIAATLIVFLALNAMVIQKQLLKTSGQVMYLKMTNNNSDYQYSTTTFYLPYELESKLSGVAARDGSIVVTLDDKNVASFVRVHLNEPLTSGEHLLKYRQRIAGTFRIGPDYYNFPKNRPQQGNSAVYSELRVNSGGDCLLLGLRDANFERLDYWNFPQRK